MRLLEVKCQLRRIPSLPVAKVVFSFEALVVVRNNLNQLYLLHLSAIAYSLAPLSSEIALHYSLLFLPFLVTCLCFPLSCPH